MDELYNNATFVNPHIPRMKGRRCYAVLIPEDLERGPLPESHIIAAFSDGDMYCMIHEIEFDKDKL